MAEFNLPALNRSLHLPDGRLMTMRKSVAADVDAMVAMFEHGKMLKQQDGDDAWDRRAFRDEVPQWIEEGYMHTVEVDYMPAAAARLTTTDEEMWGEWSGQRSEQEESVNAMYAHKIVRGPLFGGMGKIVIDELATFAQENGADYVRLDYPADSRFLNSYYPSLQFTPVGVKEIVRTDQSVYRATLAQRDLGSVAVR